MTIEIKKSIKPVKYLDAIKTLEERVDKINKNEANELIWILEHPSTFTAGTNYEESEIIDKSIHLIKSSRGGKITWHGPGQLICYLIINLNKRQKDTLIGIITKGDIIKAYNKQRFLRKKMSWKEKI